MIKTNNNAVILLVDDRPANIFALKTLLEKSNRVFLEAANGKEALTTVLNKNVDLIILDVQMPDMDGFEVAQILKSNKRTQDIPIIFVSAEKKGLESVLKGYEEGGVDYLQKPLDPEITEAKVSVLLRLQLQKRELVEKNLTLEKYSLLINNSADVIGIIDADTYRIEEINYAFEKILGYAPDESRGMLLTALLSEESKTLVAGLNKESKEPLAFETRVYCKDEAVKWLDWHVIIKDGKWFANGRDITRQKNAEQRIQQLNSDLQKNVLELKDTNKELESFSYSVSHDLRAPLRIVSGYSSMLVEDYGHRVSDEAKEIVTAIRSNVDRMGNLIDDLLAFSKLGRKQLQKSEVSMEQLVARVLSEVNDSMPNHAEIKVGKLHKTKADQSLITQVWINLISNAVKYSGKKEKPVVEIGSVVKDNEVVYYVKDNGTGFNMDYVSKLFNVFQRLHTSQEFEGTGIGLAIVQRIINKHGGAVWVEAEVDKGATFYFTIPAE